MHVATVVETSRERTPMTTRREFHKTAGLAAIAAVAAPAVARAQAAHKWKMQSLWQAGSVNQKIFEDWAKKVKEITGGRIEIEPLAVGSIVAYTETLGAMRDGRTRLTSQRAPYASGIEPGLALLGDLKGGFENPYQMQMWFDTAAASISLAKSTSASTRKMSVRYGGASNPPSRNHCRTLAEFKGVKMRVPEGSARRSGDVRVLVWCVARSEVIRRSTSGVIEATDWGPLGMNNDLGYHKIAKYPMDPGFHSLPCAEVAVNMAK